MLNRTPCPLAPPIFANALAVLCGDTMVNILLRQTKATPRPLNYIAGRVGCERNAQPPTFAPRMLLSTNHCQYLRGNGQHTGSPTWTHGFARTIGEIADINLGTLTGTSANIDHGLLHLSPVSLQGLRQPLTTPHQMCTPEAT